MHRNAEVYEAALVQSRDELRGAVGSEQATVTARESEIAAIKADALQAIGWKDQQIEALEQSAYARDLAMRQELRQMEENAKGIASALERERRIKGQAQGDNQEGEEAQRLADELARVQHVAITEAKEQAEMKRQAEQSKEEAHVLQQRLNASERKRSESTARAERMREDFEEMSARHAEAMRKLEAEVDSRFESVLKRDQRADTPRESKKVKEETEAVEPDFGDVSLIPQPRLVMSGTYHSPGNHPNIKYSKNTGSDRIRCGRARSTSNSQDERHDATRLRTEVECGNRNCRVSDAAFCR